MGIGDIVGNIIGGFGEILHAVFDDLSILWLLLPIIVFWIVFEIYFSRYKTEKLGWNSALGNGMSIFWVLVISMRFLFENELQNFNWAKFIALLILFMYTTFIIYDSFTHRISEKISFIIASPSITYFLSGVAVLWTFGGLAITIWNIIDLVLLYLVALLIDHAIKENVKSKNSGIGSSTGRDLSFGGGPK